MWFTPLSSVNTDKLLKRALNVIEVVTASKESGYDWLEQLLTNVSNNQACDYSDYYYYFIFLIFFYKSPFASKNFWRERSSHQGKKEVASIVSKSLVSFFCGDVESVNPPKLNIQKV